MPTSSDLRLRNVYFMIMPLAVIWLSLLATLGLAEDSAAAQALNPIKRTEPNDPGFISNQKTYMDAVRLPEAWHIVNGGYFAPDDQVVIAIIDSGIFKPHPDLKDQLLEGYDFVSRTAVSFSDRTNLFAGGHGDGDDEDNDPSDPGRATGFKKKNTDDGQELVQVELRSTLHGTHVAGIAAARSDNDKGIAGVCWNCRILPIRALPLTEGGAPGTLKSTAGKDSDVANAILWAAGLATNIADADGPHRNLHPANIINMSYGSFGKSSTVLRDAIAAVRAKGVIVVAAAGNAHCNASPFEPSNLVSGSPCKSEILENNKISYQKRLSDQSTELYAKLPTGDLPVTSINSWDQLPNIDGGFYPAAYDRIITVGAVNITATSAPPFFMSDFSNYGRVVDIFAPGNSIYSTVATPEEAHRAVSGSFNIATDFSEDTAYQPLNGTSMAAPIVSGIIALMMYANPDLRNREDDLVERILQASSASNIVQNQPDRSTTGMVDAFFAVRLAEEQFRFGLPATDPDFCSEAGNKELIDVPGHGPICTKRCTSGGCLALTATCVEGVCVPIAIAPEPEVSASIGWCNMTDLSVNHTRLMWPLLLVVILISNRRRVSHSSLNRR